MQLDVGFPAKIDAFIVVIHRDGKSNLGSLLPDDIAVHIFLDLFGGGEMLRLFRKLLRGIIHIFLQERAAQRDTFVADVSVIGARQNPLHLSLCLSAERAANQFVRQIISLPMLLLFISDR